MRFFGKAALLSFAFSLVCCALHGAQDFSEESSLKGALKDLPQHSRFESRLDRLISYQCEKFPGVFYFVGPTRKAVPFGDDDDSTEPAQKRVALTFDDGPDKTYTAQVLDVLKEQGVKATFFLVGCEVEKFPEVARRVCDEGHEVGNHSYKHINLRKRFPCQLKGQIEKSNAAFKTVLGIEPKLFRPPFGQLWLSQIRSLGKKGFKVIKWSLDTSDWNEKRGSPEEILARITNNIHDGAIILFHCAGGDRSGTVKALPSVIKKLQKLGYQFCSVSELIS